MSPVRRPAGSRRDRSAVALATVALALSTTATADAFWTGDGDPEHGVGGAGAASIGRGADPTVATSGASRVVASWGTTTLDNGRPVDGYVVRSYDATSGVERTVGRGCSATQAATTCTEADVPPGSWRYTVTPVLGDHWLGRESTTSGLVRTGTATLALARSLFGTPLPATTTGTVSGFAPGEAIAITMSGQPIDGSPATVGADGTATLTALRIPAVADGSHTVRVTGVDSGIVAGTGVVTDTTAPVAAATVTPTPNAAGWNRTAVDVTGGFSDGDGSGIAAIAVTTDGSDPRTSSTATVSTGAPLRIDDTATVRYAATDAAGNVSADVRVPVRIDTVPPTFSADMVEVSGGAVITTGPPRPGVAYYRGVAPGSFRFRIVPADLGGSGTATLSTTALVDVSTGFSHEPGTTPASNGAAVLSNPFSWTAGTTSSPTGTVVVTDVAGNTTTGGGTLSDDSEAPTDAAVRVGGLSGTGTRYSTSRTLSLALDAGTDARSGLAARGARLRRASAPLTSSDGFANGLCGTFETPTQIGTDDPGTSVTDTVPAADRCYRYSYAVPDAVGNVATVSSVDVKVQDTAPAALMPSALRITPTTGTSGQVVVGTTLYYDPARSGSFAVSSTSSDAVSGILSTRFPALAGFSGGGTGAPTGQGTSFALYGWSGATGPPSPGSQSVTSTDNAGLAASFPDAFDVVADATAPTHALSLNAADHAALRAGTLYYASNVAGSFRVVDALRDAGSGPASATFPALPISGWSHGAETVSTPTDGPFVSTAFSWSARPSAPSGYAVSGRDRLGSTSSQALPFVSDTTPPSGGSITYANGLTKGPTVPLTIALGSDAGSGVDPDDGYVLRDQATLNTATGVCGTFPGTYTTRVALVDGADASAPDGRCYMYASVASDAVGNLSGTGSSNVVRLDRSPKVSAVASRQSTGATGDGRLQVGDRFIVTFDEELAASSVPTSFSGATEARVANGSVTLRIPGLTNGALPTGSTAYLSGSTSAGTATFSGTVALTQAGAATTITVTVTALSGTTTAASSGALSFTPAPSITDATGTAATGTLLTSSTFKLF